MKHLKTFEEKTFEEIIPVEYVAPEREHPSYKNEEKKKKKKKKGEPSGVAVEVPDNHSKDSISFKFAY